MKTGLFICDHVNQEFQAEFGDYPDMFAALFPELEFKLYEASKGEFPENLDECDLYMATGSRLSVYDDVPWISELKATIKRIHDQQKKFVGFCFGHQLMAEALGGRVAKSPNGWTVGVHRFVVSKQQAWMEPFQPAFNLLMMCQDQVLDLPEGARLLAGNAQCPVGMFQVGEHMLGIQAHPEYPKAYDQMFMETRIDRMGEDVVKKGIASLELEVHQALVRSWVLEFVGFK